MIAESTAGGRISLSILGGYLGSGKSTWLRHQLHAGLFGRTHVIVNEAAELPIDHLLLGKAGELTVLAGGCCCCEGSTAFVSALRTLCDNQSREGAQPLDRIVLETSGLADPARVTGLIQADPILMRRIRLAGIRVMVDACHGADELLQDPLSLRQIEAADELLVSKIELAEPAALSRLMVTLRRINPGATLIGTDRGETVPLDFDVQAEPYPLPGGVAGEPPMRPVRVDFGQDVRWADLSVWLSALLHARGTEIVRVKGCVRTPAGRLLIQSVRRHVQPPEILPVDHGGPANDNVLVLIGRGCDAGELRSSFARLSGEEPQSATEVGNTTCRALPQATQISIGQPSVGA